VHVDDLAIAHNSKRLFKSLTDRLRSLWGLSAEGPLTFHLGMNIEHKVGEHVRVSQHAYIKSLEKRFENLLANVKAFDTPASDTVKISSMIGCDIADEASKAILQEINGCLLFACIMTRPDLNAVCSQIGRVIHCASPAHVKIAVRALKFLVSTPDLGIVYSSKDWSPPGLERSVGALDASVVVSYADSDWGGDIDSRNSTTGFLTMLAGGPIDWKSALQRIQALSSAEAEYVAMAEGAKSVVYVRNVLSELGLLVQVAPTPMFVDSTAAMAIAEKAGVKNKTRHIAMRFHFVRTLVENNVLDICKIDSKENPADILTKNVSIELFKKHSAVVTRKAYYAR
jgi:hypothetical protein